MTKYDDKPVLYPMGAGWWCSWDEALFRFCVSAASPSFYTACRIDYNNIMLV